MIRNISHARGKDSHPNHNDHSLNWECESTRRAWRYQRGNQNLYIEEEQTTQMAKMPKEKGQKNKQQPTHTHKTKDRVTWTPLKTGGDLRWNLLFIENFEIITNSEEGVVHPVVNASALTWFIIFIHCQNLCFLNYWIINQTKVLLPQAIGDLILFGSFGFHATKYFKMIWLFNIRELSVTDEGYSRHASCALNLISMFLLWTVIMTPIALNIMLLAEDLQFALYFHLSKYFSNEYIENIK